MSIFHLHLQSIGRSNDRSAVACAAYRSGSKLTEKVIDFSTGISFERVHDYTHKDGIAFSTILAPSNAPSWMYDREQLWNRIQLEFDTRANSVFAKDIDVALPIELNIQDNIKLITEFINEVLVSLGLVVDVNFHNDNPYNPHCHLMISTREIVMSIDRTVKPDTCNTAINDLSQDFASSLSKEANETVVATNELYSFGKKIRELDHKDFLKHLREAWAIYVNKYLERRGFTERIDHRSYKDIGIEIKPT